MLRYGGDTRSRDRRSAALGAAAEGDIVEWSSFNFKHALRVLAAGTSEAIVRRTLRKLHIKWFHASTEQMTRMLEMAGCASSVIALIPEIWT